MRRQSKVAAFSANDAPRIESKR